MNSKTNDILHNLSTQYAVPFYVVKQLYDLFAEDDVTPGLIDALECYHCGVNCNKT